LVIDSIYPRSWLGYNLSIILKDTSFHYTIIRSFTSVHVSIEAVDSAQFIFGRPFCPICKSSSDFADTIIIHSNSIVNSFSYISVSGYGSTSVGYGSTTVYEYKLYQNYPNPFNPITSIPFSLAQEEIITFSIYNTLGQRIYILKLGNLGAGDHSITWNGTNYPSGIYYYKIESDHFSDTRKMILLK
jgi:hypothetical protein